MKVAALDFGSNTFLCLIAEVGSQGELQVLEDQTEVVRLGQGLALTGKIADEALQRAEKCLTRFSEIIRRHHPDVVLAVATAATRNASNGLELVKMSERLGIPIKVISGIEEAELTFKGAISNLRDSSLSKLVVDIGGASTEVIYGSVVDGIAFKKSFEVGVVKLKETYVDQYPISSKAQEQIRHYLTKIFSELSPALFNLNPINKVWEMVAVAGTPTALAAAALGQFDSQRVDGFIFSLSDLEHWEKTLFPLTPEQVEAKYGTIKGRSDVLGIGVMILLEVMRALRCDKLKVSVRGLRYGVALNILNRLSQKQN